MKKIFTVLLVLNLSGAIFSQKIPKARDTEQIKKNSDQIQKKIDAPSKDPIGKYRNSANISQLCSELTETPYIHLEGSQLQNELVSPYAFWKLIKSNFNNLIVGNEDVSKIGRYASLDITDDNVFSFSPYIIESPAKKRQFEHLLTFNISGKLNDSKFFNFSDYRDLSASVSYTDILKRTNFKTKKNINVNEIKCKQNIALNELCEKYSEKESNIKCFPEDKRQEIKENLYEEFVAEFIDLENEVAEEYWASKNFWWWTVDVKFFGRDEVKFLPKKLYDLKNYDPQREAVYTPGIKFSLNYFTLDNTSKNSFLFTVWFGGERKHSLSEVMEPDDFQNFRSINDSLYKMDGNESVFITDFDKLSAKPVIDLGARVVKMFDLSSNDNNIKFGVSGSFSRKGLVNEKKFPSLFRSEIGLVIPLIKSDGETAFNIELFRRWDIYKNFSADNEKFYGFRFNIPISN